MDRSDVFVLVRSTSVSYFENGGRSNNLNYVTLKVVVEQYTSLIFHSIGSPSGTAILGALRLLETLVGPGR